MTQLVLPLASQKSSAMARDAFIETDANRETVTLVTTWLDASLEMPDQAGGFILSGPEASGKSFLCYWLAQKYNGSVVSDYTAESNLESELDKVVYIYDNVDKIEPELLFHIINYYLQGQKKFILCGTGFPGEWATDSSGAALVDLETRLMSLSGATMQKPDVELIAKVFRQLMRSRQIDISEKTSLAAAEGLKRDFKSLSHFIEIIDDEAMAQQKSIDVALVQSVLKTNSTIAL